MLYKTRRTQLLWKESIKDNYDIIRITAFLESVIRKHQDNEVIIKVFLKGVKNVEADMPDTRKLVPH